MTSPNTDPDSPTYDPTIKDWASSYDVAEYGGSGIDETVTGGAFASVRDGAWHGFGTVTQKAMGTLELLQLAKGDWPVYSSPVMAEVQRYNSVGDPLYVERVEDTKRVNILRDHPETGKAQILGQASSSYPLWTPRQVFVGFGDAIAAEGTPISSTAGVLYEGRQAFMSWELPNDIIVGGLTDEAVRLWLVVHTSFDGSSATTAMVTPIRAVCRNTVRVGKKKAIAKLSVRKTRNAALDALQARTALGLIVPVREEIKVKSDAMLKTRVTSQAFLNIITKAWGPGEDASKKALDAWEPKRETLMTLFAKSDTHANVRGTAWAGYNAVVEYADWHVSVKGLKNPTPQELATAQFQRSLFGPDHGTVEQAKSKAEAIFCELAGV